MTALPDFTPLQGGVPIIHEGHVIGAIGVSGAKSAAHKGSITPLNQVRVSRGLRGGVLRRSRAND